MTKDERNWLIRVAVLGGGAVILIMFISAVWTWDLTPWLADKVATTAAILFVPWLVTAIAWLAMAIESYSGLNYERPTWTYRSSKKKGLQ